jgi:predicted Fe-Mo cluster-binding NifX family protein
MKIAVPTMDGISISAHFGKSKAFLVFECEGGEIRGRELRENDQHKAHDPGGECQGHSSSVLHDPLGEHAHQHDHRGFAVLLGDCRAVIVRGMGAGAAQAMRSAGIDVCLVQDAMTPEEAVTAFATGKLAAQAGSFCACHSH